MYKNFGSVLEEISKNLDKEISEINKLIIEKVQSDIKIIPDMATHIISSGGKRIRPILTLLAAKLFGYSGYKTILISTCVEFIHTATLLHDDVIDENDIRRGLPTSNILWDNKSSVLVGDYLFAKAFELMIDLDSLEILDILSKTSSTLAKGEILQMSLLNNLDISLDQYFEIIKAKTSSLFSAATKVGALISGTSKKNIQIMEEYANNLGIIFQIVDDILDYFGDKDNLKKSIGVDLNEGKVTLPIILLIKKIQTQEEKEFLLRTFQDNNKQDNDFEIILSYLKKYNIYEETIAITDEYVEKNIKLLDNIAENNIYKNFLRDLSNFSAKRYS